MTPELRENYFRYRAEWHPSESCVEHQNEYVRCRLAGLPWSGSQPCCVARKEYDKKMPGLFKVEWLLFRSHRQVLHQRSEQTSRPCRQGHVPRDVHKPSERLRKESRVRRRPLVCVVVRARTCSAHVLLHKTRGARGRVEHRSRGRVMNKKGARRRSPSNAVVDARWKLPFTCIVAARLLS